MTLERSLRLSETVGEAELHEMYAHKRLRGEWFALNGEDIANIRWNIEACYS